MKRKSILPGFGLTMGITLTYLGVLVLVPLSTVFVRTAGLTWEQFWATVTNPRVVASYS